MAVLLATYNGAPFVEQQLRSLKDNTTPFVLHWLDDHSIDHTREAVRDVALSIGINLIEWHQPRHEGLPGAFFRLLECVAADIYLFCDQDDIWQPGKIDATVGNLLPDTDSPVLCFSDPILFRDAAPDVCHRALELLGTSVDVAMQESRVFTTVVGYGHTQGFTRKLRDIFLAHNHTARQYAFMHDMWMYAIAVAAGSARMLSDVPTAFHRLHSSNASGNLASWKGSGTGRITVTWQQLWLIRQLFARHAKGFILASSTLPSGPKLKQLLETALLVSRLDRRHSPFTLVRLVRHGVMWPNRRLAIKLAASLLWSGAHPS